MISSSSGATGWPSARTDTASISHRVGRLRFRFGFLGRLGLGNRDRDISFGGWRGLIFLVQPVAQPLPLPMIHARMERAHIFGWFDFRPEAGLFDVRLNLAHPPLPDQPG